MSAFLSAVVGILILAAMCLSMWCLFEGEGILVRWLPITLWVFLVIWGMAAAYQAEENKGPCLEYRTGMYYNSATKSMMPIRQCVSRAEWVKE